MLSDWDVTLSKCPTTRYDMCGWHADTHPQLGRNPPVASVSLGRPQQDSRDPSLTPLLPTGAVRVFEFRKKAGAPNFIRFPLFPGATYSTFSEDE